MIKGLNNEEVKKSMQKYGDNTIKETPPVGFWKKFTEGFADPMVKLLIAITIIMGILAAFNHVEWAELIGIIISIFLVTIISAKTEVASDNEYRKLKKSAKKDICKVYRNENITEITIDEIVVGDYIIIQSGDKIPADGILIQGEIKIDNSVLNGESEECKKIAMNKQSIGDYAIEEKREISGELFVDEHHLFRGSIAISGSGIMKITTVGMNTVMGSMAKDMVDESVDSPLKVKLSKLAKKISKIVYIGSVIIAIALLLQNIIAAGSFNEYLVSGIPNIIKDILQATMLAVVIVVMAVPEGLPLMIAIVLMRNTSKMLQNNVLVRKPVGIETSGSLNILFSDKTGTITKGELEVVEFFDGEIKNTYNQSEKIKELIDLCIAKNTGAMFDINENIIGGNATDKALLKFITKQETTNRNNQDIKKHQEFNSTNKYSASHVNNMTVYKGAPERLLTKATKYIKNNGEISYIDKQKIDEKIDLLADKAMRVLAFAYSNSELIENELPDDLIIVGFVAIRDDVRADAKEAIQEVKGAGIQVIMITGDRKETAVAIAKDCGLIEDSTNIALTSEELNKMDDNQIKEILKEIRVIARALPTDKSRMVRLAQEMNLVCGMTGDGVNDAPALKKADVGFAMGSGTDIAKEVGDIVILDDNFKSIKSAILYGRTIYNNILKFIKFQLTINVAAVSICTIAPFIGIKQPLDITHILWINLIMDGLGALALGSEPALKIYMKEKPKQRTQSIVSHKMAIQIFLTGTWITIISLIFLKSPIIVNLFENKEAHLTGYFSMFVLCAVFNGFNVRNDSINVLKNIDKNKDFIKILGIIILVQVILTFIGGKLFRCTPINVSNWIVVILISLMIIPLDMIRKVINNKMQK